MRKVLLLGNEDVTIKVKLASLKKFLFNIFLMWIAFTTNAKIRRKKKVLFSKIRDGLGIRTQEG